jgi:phosphoglucosamine mutase
MRKYFGTDGIRGQVGVFPVTPDFIMRLGYAAGCVLAKAKVTHTQTEKPAVLIGKDTRISGDMLAAALEAGLVAAGVDVYLAETLPTPGVAYLTRTLRLQAGVVISASHNPYDDNGIKFFSASGTKLPDEVEEEIEAALDGAIQTVSSRQLGHAIPVPDAAGRYIEFCKSTFPSDLHLRGLTIVVDCAHGATSRIAPHVLHELGADVIPIFNTPNGFNINDECGATHVAAVQEAILRLNADIGLCFDGDGDRLMMVDHRGHIYHGDHLLYILAKHRQEEGVLQGGVVGTVMSNLGVERALVQHRIPFHRTPVGDRYVTEALIERQWHLGGEQSGHILCLDKHSTGDGIIAALQVLAAVQRKGRTLSELTQDLSFYPQVLINLKVNEPKRWAEFPAIQKKKSEAEEALGETGRILIRASGTEPLLRVMVEAQKEEDANHWAQTLADIVRSQMG